MKKLFFATLLTISAAVSAFAADANKVSANAAHSFKADFRNASNVTWTVTDEYAKASFVSDNHKMEAFYNLAGDMIGTSKDINLDELPVSAKRSFAKNYNGYTVKEAIRFEGTEDVAYYISASKDNKTVILKVEETGSISNFQK